MKKILVIILGLLLLLPALLLAGCGENEPPITYPHTISLTKVEAKAIVINADLFADWDGLELTTQVQLPYQMSCTLNMKSQGKTLSSFKMVSEAITLGGDSDAQLTRDYIVGGVSYYNYTTESEVNKTKSEFTQEAWDNYQLLYARPFFTDENFDEMFEAATKTTNADGSYSIIIQSGIKKYLETMMPQGYVEDTTQITAKFQIAYHFGADNKLTGYVSETDESALDELTNSDLGNWIMWTITGLNRTVIKFDGELTAPDWLGNLSDYIEQ